jgi:uncharacterized protein (DUF2336 family)
MATSKLTHDDVTRLLAEPSAEARAETASKLATQFGHGELSENERQLAEDIFRLMVKDAEVRVRQSLAVHLKESPAVPHDVALTLARDVDTVALPILQFSRVLTDADLLDIVRGQDVGKQVAIARRSEVSSVVSDALVDTRNQEVVSNLVANEGADISEQSLQKVVDEFGAEASIQGPLVRRAKLPVTVVERLYTMVSDQLRDHLISHHQLSGTLATDIAVQSRERATISLSAELGTDDVEGLVKHLKANNRLTPSIMLRSVCMGDMAFFEMGMAVLGKVPLVNAQKLIHDPGKLGFKALYTKAKLPDPLYPAFRCAIEVARENAYDGGELDRERYCRRMIERVLTQYEELGITFDSTDLEYLLTKLTQLPTTAGTAN